MTDYLTQIPVEILYEIYNYVISSAKKTFYVDDISNFRIVCKATNQVSNLDSSYYKYKIVLNKREYFEQYEISRSIDNFYIISPYPWIELINKIAKHIVRINTQYVDEAYCIFASVFFVDTEIVTDTEVKDNTYVKLFDLLQVFGYYFAGSLEDITNENFILHEKIENNIDDIDDI